MTSTDVTQPGNLNIAVKNPNGQASNTVQLVVVAPGGADDIIKLSSAKPTVTGKDITVVEPTTAGVDTAADNLDLDAIGVFSTSTNGCSLGGNPIPSFARRAAPIPPTSAFSLSPASIAS